MPRKLTHIDFLNRSAKIHSNKYDYSMAKYINSFTYVSIICPIHGEFKQKAYSHIYGCGCPLCGNGTITKEKFILKANKTHKNKYDYSKIEYKNLSTKVKIVCPIHGDFFHDQVII